MSLLIYSYWLTYVYSIPVGLFHSYWLTYFHIRGICHPRMLSTCDSYGCRGSKTTAHANIFGTRSFAFCVSIGSITISIIVSKLALRKPHGFSNVLRASHVICFVWKSNSNTLHAISSHYHIITSILWFGSDIYMQWMCNYVAMIKLWQFKFT